tara:strand:- start:928 stop:1494 length:567 start_codon:yes stop_codon:yes gene_type:complete
MSALKLNPIPINGWRIEENQLIYITENNKKIIKDFEKVIHFDKEAKEFDVYDWFNVTSGRKHNVEHLYGDSKFVSKLLFHTPRDPRSHKGGKNVVAVSYMNEKELEYNDYSPGIVRLKTLNMMKDAGMRGNRNGFLDKKRGLYRHYAIKIEHYYREAKPKIDSLYSIDEIMSMEQTKGVAWRLLKNLF